MNFLFQTGNPETIKKLQQFITTKKIRVVIGYPREPSTLPAYVIMLAPEQEQPSGLGDNWNTYGPTSLGDIDEDVDEMALDHLDDMIASAFMNATYRIECWSDNGDLTAYMYCILKWCLWSARKDMLQIGWTNIKLEGTDLEPAPDYMPIFVYRRAAQLILTYDNLYHEDITQALSLLDMATHPENYRKDRENNIIDKNGKVVLSMNHHILLNPHFYQDGILSYDIKKFKIPIYFQTLPLLPAVGSEDTLYLDQEQAPDGGEYYKAYIWDSKLHRYRPTTMDLSSRENIIVINRNKEA